MPGPDLRHWQHQHGAIVTDVKNAQAALGAGLDDFERTHSVDDLAGVVASFDKVMARAQQVPPVPDASAAKLYAEAISAWRRSGDLLVAGVRAVDTDEVQQAQTLMTAGATAWGRFGAALESLNDLHRDPAPGGPQLVRASTSSDAVVIDLSGPSRPAVRTIRRSWRANSWILPGFLVALGLGLIATVTGVLGLATDQDAPVAGVVVILVLGLGLLSLAVWGAWRQGWLRRGSAVTDELIVDGSGVRRPYPAVRFDVPWVTVREVQVLTAETFRGETSPWKVITRRTGSSVGLGFVPRHPSSFKAEHPGLSAGPLHDRFPGLHGKFGTLLGVLTMRQQRAVEAALRQHAAGLYTGTIDIHTAVRRR